MDKESSIPAYPHSEVTSAAQLALERLGVSSEHAAVIIDHLVTADCWGRSSHGIAVRLPAVLDQLREGATARDVTISKTGPGYLVIDGHQTFGYLAGAQATDRLLTKVAEEGLAVAALRGLRHTGMLGYYADRGARAGIVTLLFGHCTPLMAPFGGRRRLLGTNPLAIGFPASPQPVLVDFGTAEIGYGKVKVLADRGEALPLSSALDAEGDWTTDPHQALSGALVPFGGHRGGALALAIQVLAGALTGAAALPSPGHDYGLLLIGISRGLFAGDDAYDAAVNEVIQAYRSVPSLPGMTVRLPGDERYRHAQSPPEALDLPEDLAAELGLT